MTAKQESPREVPVLLAELSLWLGVHAHLIERLEDVVLGLRQAGQTWDQIGQAMGMSRQAAWSRYRWMDDQAVDREQP